MGRVSGELKLEKTKSDEASQTVNIAHQQTETKDLASNMV
jgi:hypothetical protein